VAVRARSERSLALVLDRLLVDAGAGRGRLVAYDAHGREVARVERGPLDEARAHSALETAARLQEPSWESGALTLPLVLAERPLASVFLDGAANHDPAVVGEAAARAAVASGNVLHQASVQARSELLAELAHEIRNPLAGILSFSDLLPEEASELPHKYIHLMGHIQEDAQKLKRLVESVLTMVGKDATQRLAVAPLDIGQLIETLAQRFRPWAARRGVTLDAAVNGSVLADREALALTVANLVANALAATPTGGTVAVRARPGPDREPRWGSAGRAVWIEVVDTGPGLAATSVESARAGGLHIARDLVVALGGALWAEEISGGARLVLRLPASPR